MFTVFRGYFIFLLSFESWRIIGRYCFKCREAGKGDGLCTLKKGCLLCIAFSEDQKLKLTEKLSKGKNFLKESTLQTEKEKIDDSILDEEDSSVGMSSHSVVAGQSSGSDVARCWQRSSHQLTTLSNRIAAIENKDSPAEVDILVSREAAGNFNFRHFWRPFWILAELKKYEYLENRKR